MKPRRSALCSTNEDLPIDEYSFRNGYKAKNENQLKPAKTIKMYPGTPKSPLPWPGVRATLSSRDMGEYGIR